MVLELRIKLGLLSVPFVRIGRLFLWSPAYRPFCASKTGHVCQGNILSDYGLYLACDKNS